MHASLVVFPRDDDPAGNLERVLAAVDRAARDGAALVVFPEAVLTGMDLAFDPAVDMALGVPIPGPETDRIAAAATEHGVLVAMGLLERDGDRLYDSAVLLDSEGRIALRYRRVHTGWRTREADPDVYAVGGDLPVAETPFGRISFLLCGDLFDDDLRERTRALAPDLVLVPLARGYDRDGYARERWEADEEPEYVVRAASLGARVLLVNELEPADGREYPAVGGALAVAADGRVTDRLPVGRAGVLRVDLGS